MAKVKMKRAFIVLIAAMLLAGSVLPSTGYARDWWLFETVYTLEDREPVEITGSQSRIFLPRLYAETIDGIDMDITYEVTKDDEVLTGGDYAEGTWVDLNGAGTYVFTFKGVDAINSWSFEVVADDSHPSFVADAPVPLNVYLDEAFKAPTAKIIFQGEEVEAAISLQMANGAVYQYDGKAVPESGLMTVVYKAKIGGEMVEFAYEVAVIDNEIGFYDENSNLYPAGTKPYEDLDLRGAVLNSTLNKKYTFSKVVDLSNATRDVPLIVMNNASIDDSGRTLPKVYIVDAHNSKNYIEIQGRWSLDNSNVVYSVAAAAGQTLVGHLGGSSYYNGDIFGTETTFPTSCTTSKDYPAAYYYDAEEKAIYAGWYGSINLVSDLDADYQTKPWEGFTTGEVYLVVERSGVSDFICVESVAGLSLADMNKDTIPPNMTVDVDRFDDVPYAVTGQEYPLFEASAVDIMDSVVPVEVHVYRGCDATSGVEMNISDGSFIPQDAGYYTIVYSASDRFNNTVMRKINVLTLDSEETPAITAEIMGLPETAFVGEKISLPKAKNISGGSGHVSNQINLISAGGTVTPVTEGYVIISEAGKNIIEYVFTDYLGITKTYSFEIDCTVSDAPILYELEMPEVLFSGKTFMLPEAEYAGDGSIEVSITAALDGENIKVVDNTVTAVTEKAQAQLELTYTAKSTTGTTSRTYTIQVLGGDSSDLTTYFQTINGGFELEQKQNSINLTTTQTDSSVRFINSVLADKLSMTLTVDSERNDSDRIAVTISDALHPSVSVRFDIVKKPDGDDKSKSEFYINGVRSGDIVGNFYGGVASLGITYKKSNSSVVDTEGNVLGRIIKTVSGEDFNGFPSGEVNIVISTGEVGGKGFSFDVVQINNQTFADRSNFYDNYPEIMINGTLSQQEEQGAQITIPTATGSDVLSPNVSMSLTVRRGTEIIVDSQPIIEPYMLTLDQYGTYYVVYNYSDGNADRSITYSIQTLEHNPPEVKAPKLTDKAKLGEKIEIPLPIVSDDNSENVHVSVFVREPNNNIKKLNEESMYFTAEKAGSYTVIYYAVDDCSNYQVIKHEITVK